MSQSDHQADDLRELARKALFWLTHSKRALSPVELQHALATESGMKDLDEDFLMDIDILYHLCVGMIVWDRATDMVRLIHYTTRDFLVTGGILPGSKNQVTLNCLDCMLLDTFSTGRCSNPESYLTRHQLYPLYMYCVHHWGYHARDVNSADFKNRGLRLVEHAGYLAAAGQSMKGP
jgi:hypothetical protein